MNPAEEIFPMPFTRITTYRETKIGMFIENFNENVILHRRKGQKYNLSKRKDQKRMRDLRKLKKRHYHIPNYITVNS